MLLRDMRRKVWDYQKAVWLVKDLSVDSPENETPLPVEIDYTHPEEIINWLKEQNILGTVDPKELAIACQYGHFLPSVKLRGKIVGYMKIGFDKVYILDFKRDFVFPPKVAFIYDTYVDPELRGKNIAPFLIDNIAEFLKKKGYIRIYCHIRTKNLASIKAYHKCGFKSVRTIQWFNLLGLNFFSFSPERLWDEKTTKLFGFKFSPPNVKRIIK